MKKVITGKVYDTNTATQIAYWESGSKTSPSWYEEMLFRKRNGEMFLFGRGYAASPYAQRNPDGNLSVGSVIRPISWRMLSNGLRINLMTWTSTNSSEKRMMVESPPP